MSIKDLSDRYGKGNAQQLIKKAIREECDGGSEVLDAISKIHDLSSFVRKAKESDPSIESIWRGIDNVATAINEAKNKMARKIAEKYGLKSSQGNDLSG
jgi:hypothetical protein